MDNEVNCQVIRDLLPLYEDNVVSEETADLVRKHLANCSQCREVLRKMRVPMSLPPDEDEEAVRRFLEYRAEVRRKQNVKIARVVSVLAFLVVFYLCYTLIPRSWDSVSRGAEADRMMGIYIYLGVRSGDAYSEAWQINDEREVDSAVINAFTDTLRSGSYRAELRNVMNYTPFATLFHDTHVKGLDGMVQLYLVKDNEITATATFHGTDDHKVHIYAEGNPNTFFYHVDSETYDALVRLMQEYGTQQKD